jgi:hypothetical protein
MSQMGADALYLPPGAFLRGVAASATQRNYEPWQPKVAKKD